MTVAPQADAAVGAVLNNEWRLIKLIGEGGLAAVYEAENLKNQQRRAIKLLHQHFQSQRAIVERFYAEAKACFALDHPHIADTEAYAYAEDGSPYIVMELLRGFSLEELLRKQVPMAPEQAAPVMYGVLQAVGAAHQAGIVHRDIKPANLFLVPQKNGHYAPKVLDFGIAKVMDLAGGMGTKTRTGAVLGTPGYMAPEQIKNAKAVDPRTDLWAVGVVFYEMLCCRHPYGSADQFARMVAVLRDDPAPISGHNPELLEWDAFFERALQRVPDNRFQSTEEMANALRDIAQGTTAHFVPKGGVQTVAMPVMPGMVYQPQPDSDAAAGTARAGQTPVQVTPPSGPTHHTSASPGGAGQGAAVQANERYSTSAAPATPGSIATPGPPAGTRAPGNTRVSGSTQVSGSRSSGSLVPSFSRTPHIDIVDAADEEPPSMVWWGVMLVAIACLSAGLLLGYIIGAS